VSSCSLPRDMHFVSHDNLLVAPKLIPSAIPTKSIRTYIVVILISYDIWALDPNSIGAVWIAKQKCHSTPKWSIITTLVRISAISGELRSSNGPITSNLHIYCRWCSVVWIFYVGKLSKGDDDSEHEFTNNLHSNNRCMYVGMWRDEAFHWQKIQSSSLSMVMNWHSIWFYILMNRIGRIYIYEGNTQATS